MKICAIDGCDEPATSRGWCGVHYARWKRTGQFGISRRQNGSGNISKNGYIDVRIDGVRKYEHIAVAEKILGRQLPHGAEVHHVNEVKTDNRPENLVICPSMAYHKLLHRRMTALAECGNANWIRCPMCGEYSDQSSLNKRYQHPACARAFAKARYHAKKIRLDTSP